MPRHVCESRVKDLRSKRGKAVVTPSTKLKKKDKKSKKKNTMRLLRDEHFKRRSFFGHNWCLGRCYASTCVLDVKFEDANERARYRGRMANINHLNCCDYRIHKGCMIFEKWFTNNIATKRFI